MEFVNGPSLLQKWKSFMGLKVVLVNSAEKGLSHYLYILRGNIRWHNHLDPEINKKPWSEKEEEIIFEAHK